MLDRVFYQVYKDFRQPPAINQNAWNPAIYFVDKFYASDLGHGHARTQRFGNHVLQRRQIQFSLEGLSILKQLLHQDIQPAKLVAEDVRVPEVFGSLAETSLKGVQYR